MRGDIPKIDDGDTINQKNQLRVQLKWNKEQNVEQHVYYAQ